jgi:hypothetical protein
MWGSSSTTRMHPPLWVDEGLGTGAPHSLCVGLPHGSWADKDDDGGKTTRHAG